jgi:hypothetical protein
MLIFFSNAWGKQKKYISSRMRRCLIWPGTQFGLPDPKAPDLILFLKNDFFKIMY